MTRRLALLFAIASGLVAGVPAASASSATGRLLVTLEDRGSAPTGRAASSLVAAAGARLAGQRVPQLGLLTVRPEAGEDARDVGRRLRATPGVARVEVERRASLRAVPNDPALTTDEPARGAPAGVPVQWWAKRHGLFAAWDVPQARGAAVAVIDTGIDAAHPEFAGRIAAAVDNDATPGHGPATVDEDGHGTHVASMACAGADNGIGIAGAGFDCRLLVFKTDLTDGSVAASIVQATDQGADAINMSFGTDGEDPASSVVTEALNYAHARDVVLVAAAADTPTAVQGYPSDVLQPTGSGSDLRRGLGLSVTAATFADERARFAGYGSQISLAAYGAFGGRGPGGLLGAFPAGPTVLEAGSLSPEREPCRCRSSFGGDPRWAYVQGTSMASPIVAATAAMVRQLNPDLSADEVIRLVKETARRPAGPGWRPSLGWGILDAGRALRAARRLDRRPPATRARVGGRQRSTVTLRIAGGDRAPSGVVASGIRRFDVYRSTGGGPAERIARTSSRTVRVQVRPGARHAFWVVATDRAGNREARPTRPDTEVVVRPA